MLKYLDDKYIYQSEQMQMLYDNEGCTKVFLSTNPLGLTDLNNQESNMITDVYRILPKFPNLHLAEHVYVYGHQEGRIPLSVLTFGLNLISNVMKEERNM